MCSKCHHVFSSVSTHTDAKTGKPVKTTAKERRDTHEQKCKGIEHGVGQNVCVPEACCDSIPVEERRDVFCFNSPKMQARHDYIIYIDSECLVEPTPSAPGNPNGSFSRTTAIQTPAVWRAILVCNGVTIKMFTHRGPEATRLVLEWLIKQSEYVAEELEKRQRDVFKCMGPKDWVAYKKAAECYLCSHKFTESGKHKKVCDHDHVLEQYLGAACLTCNGARRCQSELAIVAHNMSGFDGKFLFQEISQSPGLLGGRQLDVVARNASDFITFSIGRKKQAINTTLAAEVKRREMFRYKGGAYRAIY